MKILVDSTEYKCWHEVGHATICLHLGGDVEFIEFLDGDARGHARTRCFIAPGTERSVACGGFAAEFYLLKRKLARKRSDDKRDINDIVFFNAAVDRIDFWNRDLGEGADFTETQDREFMDHALKFVVPTFDTYHSGMQKLARVLCVSKRVEGKRVRKLLGVGDSA